MKNAITILMFLISFSILGQEINIEIGNPYKSKAMVENIIGIYENKLYTQSYTLGSNGLKEWLFCTF